MEWSIREEEKRSGEGAEKSWTSALSLELPNLGRVGAILRLGKGGVSIHINTGRETASSIMRQEQHSLENALFVAGIRLRDIKVEHEKHGK